MKRRPRPRPRAALALPAAALALLVPLTTTGQAHAADYRYWSFWQLDEDARGGTPDGGDGGGGWVYATQGPSVTRPGDGSVEGFRFAVSTASDDAAEAAKPRGGHDFASICAGTPAKGSSKRVALVLDFGTAADAPDGERPPKARTVCARVADDATSADALAAVAAPLRYDSSAMLCAITGYPRTGCGEQVSGTRPTPADSPGSPDSSGSSGSSDAPGSPGSSDAAPEHHTPSAGVFAGIAAVVLLGLAAVWQARRRRG